MPGVSTAISVFLAASSAGAAFGSALAAGFGYFASTFVGKLLIGVGLSLVGQLFQKKPSIKERGIQTEQTTTGDTTPQKFVVGRYGLEGHAVAPAYSRSTFDPNTVLTYVLEISNIPVKGLTGRVIVDGEYTDLGETSGSRLDFTTIGNHPDGWPYGSLWFFDGTQTTAFPLMVQWYGDHPDRPWTNDHVLRGTAYAVCEFTFDSEVWTGLPSMRFEVDGISLYDPRKDDTVGGTGAHRWADSSTWEFTQNPQVINYNILRGITLPTGDIYGGEVPAEDLPLDNWFAAMNECDVLIGDRPQYQAGFEINVGETPPADVIEEMNRASFAQMSEFGGVFRVRVGAPASPVMTLTDDDFNITEPSRYDPFPGLADTFNAVTGTYVEPNDVWEGRSADAILNAQWEADDGNRRLTVELNLPSVSNKSQVQQLLTAYIKDQRRFRAHRMVLPPSFALLEPLDTVSWTSEINGYIDKVFEVISVEHRADTLNQSVMVRERDAGDVAWTSGDDVPAPSPFLGLTPPDVLTPTLTVTGEPILDADGAARRASILIEWPTTEAPEDSGLKYEVRLIGDTAGDLVASNSVPALTGQARVSDGVLPNTIYEVRARYLMGRPTEWSAWVPVTTSDTRLSAKDIVDALNARVDTAFERHDEALETLQPGGSVYQLLNEVRIQDAIGLAQEVTGKALTVVAFEENENLSATITNDYYTKVDADSAIAGELTTFQTELEDPNGTSLGATLSNDYYTKVDADSAIAAEINTLQTEIEDPNGTSLGATLSQNYYTQTSADSAISVADQNLKSELEDPNGTSLGAEISDIQATKVTAAGAVSAVEQEISAEYGDMQAMATATGFAEATADNITAGYVWRLNGSNVLEAVSVQDGVDTGPTSTFRIAADFVQITGLTQIDQAVINNLAADNGFISNLTVDTLNIAGNAATFASFSKLSSEKSGVWGNWRGYWSSGVAYAVDDCVYSDDDSSFKCILAHTSSSSNEPLHFGSPNQWNTYWTKAEKTAVLGSINVPDGVTAEIFLACNFSHGYTTGPQNWSFRMEGGPLSSNVFTNLLTRVAMAFGNDYPVVTFITSYTNNTGAEDQFTVISYWTGEDSSLKLRADETTLNLVARWR